MHSETTLAVEYGKINFNLKKYLYFTLKRIFDILVGFIGIMVMIPIAIVIKIFYLFSGDFKSIFFKQKRLGKDGKVMYIYKFRTMVYVVLDEADNYGKNKKKFLSLRPGLTGYWAANGRSNTTYKERIKMELYYVDNCSLKLDSKIVLTTIKSVLKKEGAK